jgi:cytosine/adenosine deaminase-related metal-dependent hydrolase
MNDRTTSSSSSSSSPVRRGQTDDRRRIDRRSVLKAASALAAGGLSACMPLAAPAPEGSTGAMPARGEFIVRGATLLTVDPAIGDFGRGDLHVRNGLIIAVAASIAGSSSSGATEIDGRGMICMPGFVDTHWHLWTSVCRPLIRIDDAKLGYFPVTNRLGPFYTPQDSYRAVRLGLAEAITAGATTVHNWAHNIVTPAHADAELRAMRDTGLRERNIRPQRKTLSSETSAPARYVRAAAHRTLRARRRSRSAR